MLITNNNDISLPLAVWLLYDSYDYIDKKNYISATTLLKSTKQIILSGRVTAEGRELDVADFLAARLGQAIHDSVEKAWTSPELPQMLTRLGYSEEVGKRIVVNPSAEILQEIPDLIPVWVEQRAFREVTLPNGETWTVGGKFDMVIEDRLFDTKTTSVYSYILGNKDRDYALQGGLYRWLNPERIKNDHVYIQFVFTDWQRAMARRDANYPQHRAMEYPVKMPPAEEVEQFVQDKLQELSRLRNAPESEMPDCTDEELWRSAPQYRYFSDPAKAQDPSARSTRNFNNLAEAEAFKATKGKGVVIVKPGEPKACAYCPAYDICRQKDQYFAEGN